MSMDDIVDIIRRNQGVLAEVESIDAQLRAGMSNLGRRATPPWTILGRGRFEAEEFAIWRELDAGGLSARAAVAKLRALIKQYYATAPTGAST
jgi:hypothetical protein